MKKTILSIFYFAVFSCSDAMHPDAAEISVAEASDETLRAASMPPEAVAYLFKTCSASKIKKDITKHSVLPIPADIDAILEKSCAQYNECKENFLRDIREIWQRGHLPETISSTILNIEQEWPFDKSDKLEVISAVFGLLTSKTDSPPQTTEFMKNRALQTVKNHMGPYPISIIFFPFLATLQNPQMHEFYINLNNEIWNHLLIKNSLGERNIRICHMKRISKTLLTSNKLNENDKIMVMLFAATCPELEIFVWERIIGGALQLDYNKGDDLYDNFIDYCLQKDMGLSPRDPKDEAVVAAISVEQKNEKVQEATRKIEIFFRAIGVEVNDL
ncbi:MAG: hypothetical protein LBJ71_01255 [Holosporaceae bacterium]|jgi:hypothetical protein|nr:hypothetical protein [Holosporaceae bacterium]